MNHSTVQQSAQTTLRFFGIGVILTAALAAFFVVSPRVHAAALTNVSATGVAWATDDLIGQSSARWVFSMTNATALAPGDVVQVIFPDFQQGSPFVLQNATLSATSGGVWLATTVVAISQPNRILAFVTTSSVSPAVATGTAFTITVDGVTNAGGDIFPLTNLTWQFQTGTPTNPVDPAGTLSTVKDGPTNVTKSLIRRGLPIVSDVNSSILPSSYVTGATNVTYTFVFTVTTTVPIGGKLAVNFSIDYDLSSVTTTLMSDINGAGTAAPTVSLYAATINTTGGRNQVILPISNTSVAAGNTVTVSVVNVTNPSTANVYQPFYVYTTTAQGGLIDGAYFGFGGENYNGPPPIMAVHIGGTNTVVVTAKKNTGASTVVLAANEAVDVEIGMGCPDKMFFVGTRNLSSTSSATFANILDCNYIIFAMPQTSTGTQSSTFWDNFLQPSFKETPISGGGIKNIDMVFMVPDTTLTGAITGGVVNYANGEIMAFNESHMSWDNLWNSPAYTTAGLSSTGTGYFSLRVKSGSTWQLNIPLPWDGMMGSATSQYWPPAIPAVILVTSTAATRNVGTFAYVLADKELNVILRNASTNAVITDACVGVKRAGGGMFTAPAAMFCQANQNGWYRFKVPVGSIGVEVMKPGGGVPEEFPVAVNGAYTTSTILIAAPTSYIKIVMRDSDSRPLNGAPVFAQSSMFFANATTDASGTATTYVPFGTYRVEGFAPGLGPVTPVNGVMVDGSTNPTVNITVNTASFRSITGRVFIDVGGAANVYDDGTDTPLESIQVGAWGAPGTTGGNSAISSSDGTYTLRVPTGTYNVGGWSAQYGGFEVQTVNVSSGNVSGINFILQPTGTLEITVVGGADISPLYVGAFNPATGRGNGTDQWTASSTNKVTTLTLPAGTYELHIGSPAFGELTQAGGATIAVPANVNTATSYNVTSKATLVVLSGTVRDSSDVALESVNVWASRIDGPGFFSTLTVSDGTYSLKVPDTFTYDVGANRGGYLGASERVAISGNKTLNFTLTTAGLAITGTITAASGGSVIADAWVWAEKTATSVWTGAPTDASGAYSLPVDSGSWTVYAEGPCYQRSSGLAATAGDASKNIALTAITNCTPPVPVLQSMTPASGGIVANGSAATVNIPANALGTGSDAVTMSIAAADVVPNSPNMTMVGGTVQTITALNASGQSISSLNSSAEIVFTYNENDLPPGFDENNLQVAYWNSTNNTWEPVAATVDPDKNTITASISHFTDVGVGTPGSLPAAPQNLQATVVSGSQINLTWNAVSGATSYNIYRTLPSFGTFVNVGSSASASYSNTELPAATQYYYKVSAVNASGESSLSNQASGQTQGSNSSGGGGGGSSAPPASPQTTTATTTATTITPAATTEQAIPTTQTASSTGVRTDGTLVRYEGDFKVYVLESGKKRWVQTADDFVKLGYKWNAIVVVLASEVYTDGTAKVYTRGQVTAQFTHSLARGAKGAEVSALQQKLKDLGFFPATITVNGIFGPATQRAVKAFQKSRDLAQVGVVGPLTRKALNSL